MWEFNSYQRDVISYYRLIQLEVHPSGLDGNAHGLTGDCLLQCFFIIRSDIFITVNCNNSGIFLHNRSTNIILKSLLPPTVPINHICKMKTNPVLITSPVPAGVGIVLLRVDTLVLDNELECVIHETPIAALII